MKARRGHREHLRLGTVRDQERSLVNLQLQQQLKAQVIKVSAEKLRLDTIKKA